MQTVGRHQIVTHLGEWKIYDYNKQWHFERLKDFVFVTFNNGIFHQKVTLADWSWKSSPLQKCFSHECINATHQYTLVKWILDKNGITSNWEYPREFTIFIQVWNLICLDKLSLQGSMIVSCSKQVAWLPKLKRKTLVSNGGLNLQPRKLPRFNVHHN